MPRTWLKKREYIDSFVDRSIDRKLTEILKNVVKLENKTATLEEFNKICRQNKKIIFFNKKLSAMLGGYRLFFYYLCS